jgi:hypothetical protein
MRICIEKTNEIKEKMDTITAAGVDFESLCIVDELMKVYHG